MNCDRLIYLCLFFFLFVGTVHTAAMNHIDSLPVKIQHAEPLFIDLIRDLGARKGEKEWNVGVGFIDRTTYDTYGFLVEYEWAAADRLGLEIEVPVSFHALNSRNTTDNEDEELRKPSNRVESLKIAGQYTFAVSERWQASFAIGTIAELGLSDFESIARGDYLPKDMLYNPFLVVGKRWGKNWHSLLYTGPRFTRHFTDGHLDTDYECHLSGFYMLPNSRNYLGFELNQYWRQGQYELTVRPEMRLEFSESLLVGFAPGIPLHTGPERLSFFMRVVYEPPHRKH